MPSFLSLEEFDSNDAVSAPASAKPQAAAGQGNADTLESARLKGYEAGYQAGWDDAARTDSEDQDRISAEFARNLQDLGFTFHEARSHVMHALEPLLTGMVEKVLPKLVTDTIGQTIIEELLPLVSDAADAPIDVVVAPANRDSLEAMLTSATSVPFVLVEEPTLADGQVFLRAGKTERHLDLSGAVDRIGKAIAGLYQLNEKAFQNG